MEAEAVARVPRVLLVDDEIDLLSVLGGELMEAGFEVTAVQSGRAAVAAAGHTRFAVAVTDLKMPDMDGVETMDALKRLDPGLPVVMATGYRSASAQLEARGAYRVILKPFTLDEVLRVVTEAASGRR